MKTKSIHKLSNNVLVQRLERLCDTERETMVTVLRHLIEVERRELYLERGYSSLHEFCTGHLKYSGSTAGRRITAARCVKKYPRVAGMLLRGEINLSVLSLVADILTRENYRDILSHIKGRPYREVQRLVARYHPQREVRDKVNPVYIKTELKIIPENGSDSDPKEGGEKFTPNVGSSASLESTGYGCFSTDFLQGGQTEVVLEEKYKLEFAVNAECMKKIERAKALLSSRQRKKPNFESLFNTLLDEYLDRHSPEGRVKRREKRRTRVKRSESKSKKSRSETEKRSKESHGKPRHRDNKINSKQSRFIPQTVRDEVYTRDGGRCTYVGTGGRRCIKKDNLEVDHVVPFAMGGKSTKDNLRLLCAKHNMLEAERAYGKDHMKNYRRRE